MNRRSMSPSNIARRPEDSASERAIFDLAIFAAGKVRLRVIDNASGDENLAVVMARENCVAGVNGGYFDPEFDHRPADH